MKKAFFTLLFITFTLIISAASISATDMISFDDYIGDEISDNVPREIFDIDASKSDPGKGLADGGSIIAYFADILNNEIKECFSPLFVLCGVIIAFAVFSRMSDITRSDAIKNVYLLTSSLCLGIVSSKILIDMWKEVYSILEKLQTLLNSISVSIVSVYAATGNVNQAAVNSSNLSVILLVISNIIKFALLPVLQLCFALNFTGCISSEIDLGAFSSFLRRTFTTVLVFVMGVLTTVLSIQNVLASRADSMLVRGVKMAAGSFIPIVGNAVGEASKTVTASIGSLKAILGAACIAALAATVIPILIKLWATKLCFSFSASFAGLLGGEGQGKYLKGCGELLNFCIALLISVALVFTVNLMIFTRSAPAVSG